VPTSHGIPQIRGASFYPQLGIPGPVCVTGRRYDSNMYSSCRDDIVKRFGALHDAVSDVLEVSSDVLTTPECLALLERLETETRRLPAAGHPLINQLARQASNDELGGRLSQALASRLRITRGEASRRIHEAIRGPTASCASPAPLRGEAQRSSVCAAYACQVASFPASFSSACALGSP
jgi:Domain of unknown function (DUF222)